MPRGLGRRSEIIPKLSDTQAVLLAAAAARPDLSVLPPPATIRLSTLAIGLAERCRFFAELLPCVLDLRATTGRPHWLIVEEANQFLPRGGERPNGLDRKIAGSVLITVEPKWLPVEVLRQVDALLAFGSAAPSVVAAFAREIGLV